MPFTFAYNGPLWTREDFLFVVNAREDIRMAFYSTVVLLIYDHLLTLAEEVQYIWPARWTIIKIVFLANRYLSPVVIGMGIWGMSGVASGLTDRSCRTWLITEYAMGHFILSLASFIMVFRLHAAWPERSVFVLLIFIWTSANAASLMVGLMTLGYQRQLIYHEKTSNVCISLIPGLWKLYLSNVMSHIAFLVVLLYKALGTPRPSKSPILGILLKDGIIYYSVVLVATLQTVIIWGFVDWANHLPVHLMWAICATQVSRFFLSLKSVQYRLPFRRHRISTTDQIVRVDRESYLDCDAELSPYPESPFGGQMLSITDDLLHHRVAPVHDKVPSIPLTTTGERQEPAHQQPSGWFVSLFQAPSRSRHVEVDADAASWWVEDEDRGPGMQESQIGRYDAWL